MATRDLSPKGILDLAEATQAAVDVLEPAPAGAAISRAIFTHTGGMPNGSAQVFTISLDDELAATFTTLPMGAGGATARTGAGAVSLDVGGGVGEDPDQFLRDIMYGLSLLFGAGDISPVDLEVQAVAGPTTTLGEFAAQTEIFTGGSLIFKSFGKTITLATALDNTSVVNQM